MHPGFPDAEAVLIVEIDGPRSEVAALFAQVEAVCTRNDGWGLQVARDEAQRGRIWMGRKAAFAAMGRIAPNYYVQDGVIPRSTLPEVLRRIRQLEIESGLTIGNVFHAGDGNLHPLVCYDDAVDGQADLAEQVATEILTYCLDVGGSLTGEHGIGADKACHMPKMFTAGDLETMQLVRAAFDPTRSAIPTSCFPPRVCAARFPGRIVPTRRRLPASPTASENRPRDAQCPVGRPRPPVSQPR